MFFPLSLHLHVQDGIRNFMDDDVFSACYLWHKISVVPSQEGVWNPPDPELKLNMVEMHQWKKQSNSIPQISWDIPLHRVKAWKSFAWKNLFFNKLSEIKATQEKSKTTSQGDVVCLFHKVWSDWALHGRDSIFTLKPIKNFLWSKWGNQSDAASALIFSNMGIKK